MDLKRIERLRRRLAASPEARLTEVETYLSACGWRRRKTKGGHRAWVKEGKRTLVIPAHGKNVREHVIRQVLEATASESAES